MRVGVGEALGLGSAPATRLTAAVVRMRQIYFTAGEPPPPALVAQRRN